MHLKNDQPIRALINNNCYLMSLAALVIIKFSKNLYLREKAFATRPGIQVCKVWSKIELMLHDKSVAGLRSNIVTIRQCVSILIRNLSSRRASI